MKKITALLFISACTLTFVNHSLSMENSGIMEVEATFDKSDCSRSEDTSSQKNKTKSSKKSNEKPKSSTNQLLQENNALLYALYQQNAVSFQHRLNTQRAQQEKKTNLTELINTAEFASNNISKTTDSKIKKIHENKTS